MWYIEAMCQPHVYKRAAKCVEGDVEVIGRIRSSLEGHQMAIVQVQPALEPRVYGWHGLVLELVLGKGK